MEQDDLKKTGRKRVPTARIFNEEYVVAKNKDSHLMDSMDLKMIREQMSNDKPSPKKYTRGAPSRNFTAARKIFDTRRNMQNMSPVAKKLVQITKRKYGRPKKTSCIKNEPQSPERFIFCKQFD